MSQNGWKATELGAWRRCHASRACRAQAICSRIAELETAEALASNQHVACWRALDDVYDRPFASATAEKAAPVLACAGDGSSAACLALGRLLIVPLLSAPGSGSGGDARADPPAPFVVGGAVQRRGEVPRFFEYLPSDASRVAVVLGDARGDVPKSTRVVAAGVDVASRRCYVVWAVDGLPPLAQGLGTLRGGGLVVLFRNSLARIRDGGAPAARFNFPST